MEVGSRRKGTLLDNKTTVVSWKHLQTKAMDKLVTVASLSPFKAVLPHKTVPSCKRGNPLKASRMPKWPTQLQDIWQDVVAQIRIIRLILHNLGAFFRIKLENCYMHISSGSNHFRHAHRCRLQWNQMGRIRIFPLLFQNGFSQSLLFFDRWSRGTKTLRTILCRRWLLRSQIQA